MVLKAGRALAFVARGKEGGDILKSDVKKG